MGKIIAKTKFFELTQEGEKLYLKTEYNPEVVKLAKKLDGRWVKPNWVINAKDLDLVNKGLIEIFGTDGSSEVELVDVIVFLNKLTDSQSLFMFGRQLAHRWARSKEVVLGNDVFIEQGGFPAIGGESKKPRLDWDKGTVLQVRNVPKGAIEKEFTQCKGCFEVIVQKGNKPPIPIPVKTPESLPEPVPAPLPSPLPIEPPIPMPSLYRTQHILPEKLEAIQIRRQSTIESKFGSPLNLVTALTELRRVTRNYTVENAQAIQADGLLMQLVERDRKPEVALTKEDYAEAIEVMKLMAEDAKGADLEMYTEALEVLEIMYESL